LYLSFNFIYIYRKALKFVHAFIDNYILTQSGFSNRKILAELFNITRDSMFRPKHNWTLLVQEHLNKSLGEEGLIRQSLSSKQASFLSHPLPECACRVSSAEAPTRVKGDDSRILYGGEDECPEWMQHGERAVSLAGEEGGKLDENEFQEYENDTEELPESFDSGGKTNVTLVWDQDEEMDPND
jgi:hypothetical protein